MKVTHLPIIEHLEIQLRRGTDVIKHLPGNKWILTNSPEPFAVALLKKLGFDSVFLGVYGITKNFRHAKPDPKSYQRISLGAEVVVIDDWEQNLVLPHTLEWKTIWFPEEGTSIPSVVPPHIDRFITTLEDLTLLS